MSITHIRILIVVVGIAAIIVPDVMSILSGHDASMTTNEVSWFDILFIGGVVAGYIALFVYEYSRK